MSDNQIALIVGVAHIAAIIGIYGLAYFLFGPRRIRRGTSTKTNAET